MKKFLKVLAVLVLAIIITGCGGSKKVSKNSSAEDLLDIYIDGFMNSKPEQIISVYPDFTHEYYKKYITKEAIDASKERFGSNIKMTYEITGKEKLSDEDLESLNEGLKNYFDNSVAASECYAIHGSTKIKGSDDERESEINELWYCNFEGNWRLVED